MTSPACLIGAPTSARTPRCRAVAITGAKSTGSSASVSGTWTVCPSRMISVFSGMPSICVLMPSADGSGPSCAAPNSSVPSRRNISASSAPQ